MNEVTGRFDLGSWEEEVYDEQDGVSLLRVRNTKTFEGGIQGVSEANLLQVLAHNGSVSYVGMERVRAKIDDREGDFVLRHTAYGNAGGGVAIIEVVADSAGGDLKGLKAKMDIKRSPEGEHTYVFDYEL
ncbi:DUF3224 domain-containing protein [Amycolatopsis sp. cmx-11-12]|jgi:hypothetical protein|uniref:DUF3224 domain-containing protein n=1 Tax=Amycolatopsis sp. cmx-11-12 TaxID=2785795 RepID=UPI003917C5EC